MLVFAVAFFVVVGVLLLVPAFVFLGEVDRSVFVGKSSESGDDK